MTEPNEQPSRRFPRIARHHTVMVERLDSSLSEGFVRTKNVGLGGCGFESDESFGEGAVLRLLISIERRVFSAEARVVYEHSLADGRYDVGVEFLEDTAQHREVLEDLFDH